MTWILLVALVVVGLAALGFFVAFVVRASRRAAASETAALERLAEDLGGELVPASGPWHRRRSRAVVVERGRSAIRLEHFVVPVGQVMIPYTRAVCPGPSSRRLVVAKRSALTRLGGLFGARDLGVGDRAFDESFAVRTDDPEWARRCLTSAVRAALLDDPRMVLRVQRGRIASEREGKVLDSQEASRLVELVAAAVQALAAQESQPPSTVNA